MSVVTFTVRVRLLDFGGQPRVGVKVLAAPIPAVKKTADAVHGTDPEDSVTNYTGLAILTLISIPGLWYRISGKGFDAVRFAAYFPDPSDPTTGTAFPQDYEIDFEDLVDESPTPGYEAIAFLAPGGYVLPGELDALDARVVVLEEAPGGGGAAVQVTLDAADFFPDPLVIPANATLVEVLPITDPISVAIEDADDGAGFILHLAGGASNVTFTNAYPEGTFEDEVWATVVRASGAWRVFTTDSGALANLSDVAIWGGQQDGDALLWNDGTQRWEAGTVPPPTTMNLRHLVDVDDSLDSADDGQTLVKQDGIWTAGAGGGVGVVPPEPFIIPPGVGQYLPVLAYGGHYTFPCTGGRSYPCPQYAHEAMNVDAVGAMVDTGVGGATIELALYTWGGGITSTLVSTLGSVDASSAGLKVLTFTPLSLAAGLHLIVARPSTNVSVWGVSGGTMVQDGPPDAGTIVRYRFRFPHHAAASLPSSITWDYGAGVFGNNFPKFQMRRSA